MGVFNKIYIGLPTGRKWIELSSLNIFNLQNLHKKKQCMYVILRLHTEKGSVFTKSSVLTGQHDFTRNLVKSTDFSNISPNLE